MWLLLQMVKIIFQFFLGDLETRKQTPSVRIQIEQVDSSRDRELLNKMHLLRDKANRFKN